MDIVGVSMILMGKINIHVSFKVWIADDADSYRAFSDRFVAPRGICYPPPFPPRDETSSCEGEARPTRWIIADRDASLPGHGNGAIYYDSSSVAEPR